MKVANKKIIRRISFQSMKAARFRNIIAILAIALTSMLFTSLFTIAISIGYSIEQSNFRQAGGYSHGTLKYLTEGQFEELKEDSLIKEYGLRRYIGMPSQEPFSKIHLEVSYMDQNCAKWAFLETKEGKLPKEGTREAATDTRVLEVLGIKPEIGTEFTMTFDVDGTETTESFILSGWWEYDEGITVSHVIVPESRAEEIFEKLGTQGFDGMTGTYNLDIMLKNKTDIAGELLTILEKHGYQSESSTEEDNYIATGVNWGYVSAQISNSMDIGTLLAIIAILLVIILTGYLIIYNVFQISVSNDIRFYGLLKTIGTTGRQLKRIILWQACSLAAVGIPIGLVCGYGIGAVLTPIVMSQLNGVNSQDLSVSPLIFLGAGVFSLLTVFISCHKPGKAAAKVSPIEAVRYTEQSKSKRKVRKAKSGASILKMAFANMGRNKSKTIVTVVSLSLSVVLLNMTVNFTKGFDMDKYLSSKVVSDFIVADAGYLNVGAGIFGLNSDTAVTEEVISELHSQGGIKEGGRTYGMNRSAYEFVSEEWIHKLYGRWMPEEEINSMLNSYEKVGDLFVESVQLYGMEKFCINKLEVLEGDISKLYEDGNYVAAVCLIDDYGNADRDSQWAKIGDKLKVRYTDEWEYYNTETGEIFEKVEDITDDDPFAVRSKVYKDVEYEVAALVAIPNSLSYRYYGSDEFVLNADTFKRDTQTQDIMYYAYDMEEAADNTDNNADTNANTENMENFLADYTESVNSQYDYESKETYASEFYGFRDMVLIMGSVLSFIVGLVGVLNFLNAILTGIMTRRREFAVLQSVGMTGKQLKQMLVAEGLYYTFGAVLLSLILNTLLGPFIGKAMGSMFWFFTYKFTVVPILIIAPIFALLGVAIPLITYHFSAKKSIVERLRETE